MNELNDITAIFGYMLFFIMGLYILLTLIPDYSNNTIGHRIGENILKLIAPLMAISTSMLMLTLYYSLGEVKELLFFNNVAVGSTPALAELSVFLPFLAVTFMATFCYTMAYIVSRIFVNMMSYEIEIKKFKFIDYALASIAMLALNHVVYFNFFN